MPVETGSQFACGYTVCSNEFICHFFGIIFIFIFLRSLVLSSETLFRSFVATDSTPVTSLVSIFVDEYFLESLLKL